MDSVNNILGCLEDIKENITDNQYKIMIEELKKIYELHAPKTYCTKFIVKITFSAEFDSKIGRYDGFRTITCEQYQPVKISERKRLTLMCPEFDEFVKSDQTFRIFTCKNLLRGICGEEDEEKWIVEYTITKIE